MNKVIPGEDDQEANVIAYVAMPSDFEREDYISQCFKQQRISVKTENGGYLNRVPISIHLLNFIEFPLTVNDNGSPVLLTNIPQFNHYVVSQILPDIDETADLTEKEFKIQRVFGEAIVQIQGNPKTGVLSLTVDGDNKASNLLINVHNKTKNGLLKCNVNGKVVVEADSLIDLKSAEGINVTTVNKKDQSKLSSFNQASDSNQFQNDKFIINDGNEPITLGNKVRALFDELFDMLGESTTTTSLGQMPLLNGQQIKALKDKTEAILSQVSFTD